MKTMLCFILVAACGVAMAQPAAGQRDYPISPVPFTAVTVNDGFWLPRIETNRTVTIPASFERCRTTGRVHNFEMAAARTGKFCTTYPFDDTDIYKTIEGASYSLAVHPDPALAAYLDSLIGLIGRAQEADGYLYTARTIDPQHVHPWAGPERWMHEAELSHELYCSGHLFEAAVAHYNATGRRNFLDIALKNADLLVRTFGPDKKHVAPGHEVVEMGLVKLYRVTGRKEYLDLAKFFLEMRGERQYDKTSTDVWKNGRYWQAHEPVTAQDEVVGHAVRAMYLYSAMTDVAALTGDSTYVRAVDRLWDNMVGKKMYLHGGIGAIGDGERFGDNYELPNATAYAETCAAVGSVFWDYRMFLLHGDAKYIDVMERTLYNGLLSGVGLDGKSFFYTNAMEVVNGHPYPDLEPERAGWFTCSCCPTNLARFLPSVPGYVYAVRGRDVYVNLYVSGKAKIELGAVETAKAAAGMQAIGLEQQSNYPLNGDIRLRVEVGRPMPFRLLLRIPGWARGEAIPGGLYRFAGEATERVMVKVNGQVVDAPMQQGYAVIDRKWKNGDSVELVLPMKPQMVEACDSVKADIGKVALQCGPLVYCAEWADNSGRTSNLILPVKSGFSLRAGKVLAGVNMISAAGVRVVVGEDGLNVSTRDAPIELIPYYAWANRGKGEMTLWFPEKVKEVELVSRKE
ncbi:MAG TPA: glycoside hydrolase family 127 protein [Puia sp.]|nr:glycoside hydrolase family 127 protein [Puia sp.]